MHRFVSELWHHPYKLIGQDLLSRINWPINDCWRTPDRLILLLLGMAVLLLLMLRAVIAKSA